MKKIQSSLAALTAALLSVSLLPTLHAGSDTTDAKNMVTTTRSANEQMGNQWFVGIQAGADFSGNTHTSAGTDIDSTTLALGGLKGGYIWNTVPYVHIDNLTARLELEADWSGDRRSIGGSDFGENNAIVLLEDSVGYRIGKFEPYVGGAVGFINTWTTSGPVGTASDISLAYGPMAGVRYNIDEHWQLFTEYKYLLTDDKSFSSGAGTLNTHGGVDQLVSAGLNWKF